MSNTFIPFILSSKSISLRECLNNFTKKEIEIDDIGVVTDLDTLSDYENIKTSFKR